MEKITIDKSELKSIIQESVREAIADEMMKLRALLTKEISDSEMKEIQEHYGIPSEKKKSPKARILKFSNEMAYQLFKACN
jgi:DNA primase large subunit